MKIWATNKGDFKSTFNFLKKAEMNVEPILHECGRKGVEALKRATPEYTGLASLSWDYSIEGSRGKYTITFHNYDIENGYNVAILIQYGHGTGTGGYVAGRDFINPALQPIFDNVANDIWKELNK